MSQRNKKNIPYKLTRRQQQIGFGLLIAFIFYYFFLRLTIIGQDDRYETYVIMIPLFSGLIALGIYRRKFINASLTNAKGSFIKVMMVLSFLAQGLFTSFLSFGLFALLIWTYVNKHAAYNSPTETIRCPIEQVSTKRSFGISFYFKGRSDHLNTRRNDIADEVAEHPERYILVIDVKQGIWNHYLVQSWEIERKY